MRNFDLMKPQMTHRGRYNLYIGELVHNLANEIEKSAMHEVLEILHVESKNTSIEDNALGLGCQRISNHMMPSKHNSPC